MVFFEVPKSGGFIRAFEATKECFQNERRALEEGRSALFQQCGAARSQIHQERQSMRGCYDAADGEKNALKQTICQLQGQIQHMPERTESLRDANGVLAAEHGFLKAGRVQLPRKREARARKEASPTPSCRSSVQTRSCMHPQPANSSSCATRRCQQTLGFAGSTGCGLGFLRRPPNRRKIFACTRACSRIWWQHRSNTYLQRAATCPQCHQGSAFCCRAYGMQWGYGPRGSLESARQMRL
ncbi:hypothetical protein TRVL_09159 [Trypanosoma vivax]|nr:hypothetical protein TRVL_09159 [Trypanosoma vivax]